MNDSLMFRRADRPALRKRIVAAAILGHLALLTIAVAANRPQVVTPDKTIDVVEVFDPPRPVLPPPPKTEPTPPPLPKETKVPAVDLGPAAPASSPGAMTVPSAPDTPPPPVDTEPDFIPQFKLSALPAIPDKEFRSRIVYPVLAARQGIEATVVLLIYVDQTGKIRKIVVQKDPGNGFAEAALKALDGMTLKAGEIDGIPVATAFRQVIPFQLQ
jgi:protein TonB